MLGIYHHLPKVSGLVGDLFGHPCLFEQNFGSMHFHDFNLGSHSKSLQHPGGGPTEGGPTGGCPTVVQHKFPFALSDAIATQQSSSDSTTTSLCSSDSTAVCPAAIHSLHSCPATIHSLSVQQRFNRYTAVQERFTRYTAFLHLFHCAAISS